MHANPCTYTHRHTHAHARTYILAGTARTHARTHTLATSQTASAPARPPARAWACPQIARLRKALASSRETGHASEAGRLQGKEAAQQLDAQLAGLRQRILHLEASVRAKDREVDKVQREMAAAQAAEAEVRGDGRGWSFVGLELGVRARRQPGLSRCRCRRRGPLGTPPGLPPRLSCCSHSTAKSGVQMRTCRACFLHLLRAVLAACRAAHVAT